MDILFSICRIRSTFVPVRRATHHTLLAVYCVYVNILCDVNIRIYASMHLHVYFLYNNPFRCLPSPLLRSPRAPIS